LSSDAREPQPAPSDAHPLHDTLAWTAAGWHFLFYAYLALHVLFATRVLGMAPA
jgi:hypothetical protein